MYKYLFYAVFFMWVMAHPVFANTYDFLPFTQDELPKFSITINCQKASEIRAEQAEDFIVVQGEFDFETDAVIISKETLEVTFIFQPFSKIPFVLFPEELSPAIRKFILSALEAKQGLKLTGKETFESWVGETKAEHAILDWRFSTEETPASLLPKIQDLLGDLQKASFNRLCQNNPQLVGVIKKVLSSEQTHELTGVNITNMKNIARLLTYIVGGTVKENSSRGVALNINSLGGMCDLPTKGKMGGYAYQGLIKENMRNLLRINCISYYPMTKTLDIGNPEPAKEK